MFIIFLDIFYFLKFSSVAMQTASDGNRPAEFLLMHALAAAVAGAVAAFLTAQAHCSTTAMVSEKFMCFRSLFFHQNLKLERHIKI